ncbi:hypothetical protein IPF86_00555 [Candidatus Nomurabacteria bacterium]|jgi:hypothetical protein|nr:MAG: hypothetical protein IPF86_00555 [Candidatus Nomurabacteria bacterium]
MHKLLYKSILETYSFVACSVVIFFLLPTIVFSATLSLLPSTITTSVGNTFSISVIANTSGKYINNSDGEILFPVDLLQVVSISKSNSIFTLWVEEPTFSNTTGVISYNGGIVNPGYKGGSGTIATITFKAKKVGTASIVYSDAAVRENDGLGTNILISKSGSVVAIGILEDATTTEDTSSSSLVKPQIYSSTHPNQEIWYANNTASFNWKVPDGVSSLKTLLNKISNATPTLVYDSSVSEKTLTNIVDGIHYFHLSYSSAGGSSPTAHYKIKIDATPPKEFVPVVHTVDYKNLLTLNAEDVTSGIDYYTIKIDSAEPLLVKSDTLIDEQYSLPVLNQGNHSLVVTAYDRAGNYTTSELLYESSYITAPVLSIDATEIVKGESVIISGQSDYPDTPVVITVQLDGKIIKEYTEVTSTDGTFSFTTDKIKKVGILSIYGTNILSDEVKSQPSEKIFVKVNQTSVAQVTITMLWLLCIILCSVGLLIVCYIGWHKYFGTKRKIERELKETITKIHNELVSVKEDLAKQLLSLEAIKIDRVLNKKEKVIFTTLQKNIDEIDMYIEKRLKKLL